MFNLDLHFQTLDLTKTWVYKVLWFSLKSAGSNENYSCVNIWIFLAMPHADKFQGCKHTIEEDI